MPKMLLTTAVLLALGAAAQSALAFNSMFLKDAPITRMSDADVELMQNAFFGALDSEEDGYQTEWQGETEGVGGKIKVAPAFQQDGRVCRKAAYQNHAEELKNAGVLVFCRADDGSWQVSK